jgi:predicted nucleic acid-binding protein
MRPVADSGLLVGYLDSSDQYHTWAVQCLESLRTALTTCEAVIAEVEYLVPGSGPLLMEMVRRGTLQVVPLLPKEAEAIGVMLKRYRKMQFADACLVRLSELLPDSMVYTTDKRDFSVYRRHRNQGIKFISP